MRVRTLIKQISGDLSARAHVGYGTLSPRGLSTSTSPRNMNSEEELVELFTHDGNAVVQECVTSRETIVLSTGTFDPPHKAHVKSIEMMREEFGVDQVVVSAVFDPVHKAGRGLKDSHHHRSQMVKIAVEHIDHVRVDERPFISTGQALARLHAENPYNTRIFIMGMDLLESFPTWDGGPERYLRHAHIVVIPRPGYSVPDSEEVQAILEQYGVENIDELRAEEAGRILLWQQSPKDLERGFHHHSINDLLQPKVAQYIVDNKLYVARKPAASLDDQLAIASRSILVAPRARLFDSFSKLVFERERDTMLLEEVDSTLTGPYRK